MSVFNRRNGRSRLGKQGPLSNIDPNVVVLNVFTEDCACSFSSLTSDSLPTLRKQRLARSLQDSFSFLTSDSLSTFAQAIVYASPLSRLGQGRRLRRVPSTSCSYSFVTVVWFCCDGDEDRSHLAQLTIILNYRMCDLNKLITSFSAIQIPSCFRVYHKPEKSVSFIASPPPPTQR